MFSGAYISETVHASHRNTLNSIQIVMVGFGSLFALVLGYLLDWRPIAFILAAVSFVTTFSILFLPETPYYLIEKGKNSDARASLIFFRGSECDTIDQELAEIIEARDQKGGGLSVGRCRVLTSHSFLKPFLCIGPIHFLFRYYLGKENCQRHSLSLFQVVIILHNLSLHDDIFGQGRCRV